MEEIDFEIQMVPDLPPEHLDTFEDVETITELLPDPGSQALEELSAALPSDTEQREPDIDLETLSNLAQLDDLKLSMNFVRFLQNASLDDREILDEETVGRIRNPPEELPDISDPDLRLSLDLFLSVSNSSQETYNSVKKAILRRFPDIKMLSHEQVKSRVAQLSGVVPVTSDMCPNSCLSYVGPLAHLDTCSMCGEPRYDPIQLATNNKKIPRQRFDTIPIGPQLQALWRDPVSATNLQYRRNRTCEILEELKRNGGRMSCYEDLLHGSDYLHAVGDGRIKEGDMVLMLSLDGAQLYRNKASDCWMYIWVIFDHSPDVRYKKRYVLPGAFIPGPNKPKNFDSFLYPGFHHLAALQKEGFRIWDGARKTTFISRPFFALGNADGPGMTYLSGFVSHHGKNGCRLYCSLQGRHKPGGSHYYPALLKPLNYTVDGCNHDDVPASDISPGSSERYYDNLQELLRSSNETQYRKRRLKTGLTKPSLLLGLPNKHSFGIPGCFGLDIMHLVALNIPDLLISLWRASLDCEKTDSVNTWDWAVLKGEIWKKHGQEVAAATPYLPGSFDRPPRNPAEKVNSGYKAWEFLMYIYGLGPGLFYNILPGVYWKNFCKLVLGVRILSQHKILATDLCKAHKSLNEFCDEFELLYYKRRINRLHFIRPALHTLRHLAPEVQCVGPLACSSQWTLERTIGNLGEEIRQPSNPFANLSQRGIRRCQVNALQAMFPFLDPVVSTLPRGAIDLGDGYVLLRAMERNPHPVRECEIGAFRTYMRSEGEMVPDNWHPVITRWARLRLPNGLIARSAWKEKLKPLERVRIARVCKVSDVHPYHNALHLC
jgi:hypothetical protein